jgi:DNA (cytosine-5)-methyltransferase 1
MTLTVAGSFTGTGGLELGFQQAGFDVVWSNEIDPHARETYALNFNPLHMDPRSIEEVPAAEIPDHDVFVAGFPCQPFSHAGTRLGFADVRGTLFEHVVRIIEHKKPAAFLLENVKGLVSHDSGNTLSTILTALYQLGYRIEYHVMNAAEYGNIPQGRERIYIVGMLGNQTITWPEPVTRTVTVRDLITPVEDFRYYYDHRYGQISDKVNAAVIDDAVYQYRKTYVRRNQSGVCPTLTANMGTAGHNVPIILDPERREARRLTPAECFKMQGYPDDFNLPNIANGHLYKQAGNAVAVPVVRRIAEQLMHELQTALEIAA